MSGYQPPVFAGRIDLDLSRNEGRSVLETSDLDIELVGDPIRRYPDTSSLVRLLAERHGVDEDRVLVTAGGDDAIFRFLLASRAEVVATTPTFEMIARYADQIGVRLSEVVWWDGRLPIEEMAATEAEVVVVVSPNNPTGSTIEEADLVELADRFRLVLFDAAYAEFADVDLTPVALELGNVVVVRTLSKAFGLAGLRVGYLMGAADVVAGIAGFGSPYAVSGVSVVLASRALETGLGRAESYARMVMEERERLIELLAALGAGPLPSQGNFVLASDVDPADLIEKAASAGVGLRHFPGRSGLESSVRIGLPGSGDDFDRLVRVLTEVLADVRDMEVADVS